MVYKHSLTVSATHIIRLYLWDMMQRFMSDTWVKIDTGQGLKIPIIPVQEQPEAQTSDRPYIVYTYDMLSTGDLFQHQIEQAMFSIYSQSSAVVSATTKLMVRLFNKYDITAREINQWLHTEAGVYGKSLEQQKTGNPDYDTWIDELRNFKFTTVNVAGVAGQQPSPGEAGRLDSLITIELNFVERDTSLDTTNWN